jgi:hypothetical protein
MFFGNTAFQEVNQLRGKNWIKYVCCSANLLERVIKGSHKRRHQYSSLGPAIPIHEVDDETKHQWETLEIHIIFNISIYYVFYQI